MEEYKCPICGNKEAVDVAIFSTATGINLDKFGEPSAIGHRIYCGIKPRGLINWTTEGSLDGYTEIRFNPQVTTKICTGCGFVSFHALDLANAVAKDLELLQEKNTELLAEKEKLLKEKAALNGELDSIQEKQERLKQLIQSEDITIRQQKEHQSDLAVLEARKTEIYVRIRDIGYRVEQIEYNRGLVYKANKCVHDHSIDNILSNLK